MLRQSDFCMVVLLALCSLQAQAQVKQKHLIVGGGWKYYTVLDQALSPNKYQGSSALLQLGFHSQNDTVINQLDIDGSIGRVGSNANDLITSTALLAGGDIGYRRLYHVMPLLKGTYHWFLGGGFLNHALYREYENFTNNIWQYDISSSLSLESLIKRTVTIKGRRLVAAWQLSIPIVSATLRPAYNTSLPEGFIHHWETPVKATLKSVSYNTLNSYARGRSGIALMYYLLNGNALRIGYNWDFYHFNKVNKLSIASHELGFGLLFNLSKPE